MLPRIKIHALSAGLIGAGALAWTLAGRPLLENPDLRVPLNILGINRSPYGEVFAMALQGSIDTNFHIGMFGASSHSHQREPGSLLLIKSEPEAKPAPRSLTDRMRAIIASMRKASEQRTNPRPSSEAHKFYLRRQAEDKLRFAYQLDPSHYGNYNSLHFLYAEGLTTRPELTPLAVNLAEETIQYCLKQEGDPRPSLTAAAAATNILHLMFTDQKSEHPKYNPAQMRETLVTLDQCLARYQTISAEWERTKNWERLSRMRIQECNDRFSFICKIRDAAEKTILRYEGNLRDPQAAN